MNCNKYYIGHTSKSLKILYNEYILEIKCKNPSLIFFFAKHTLEHNHNIDWVTENNLLCIKKKSIMCSTSLLENFFSFNKVDFYNILNTKKDYKHNDIQKCILDNNTFFWWYKQSVFICKCQIILFNNLKTTVVEICS